MSEIPEIKAIIGFHEKRISDLESNAKDLRDQISRLETEVSAIQAKLDALRDEIKESNKRNVWVIGTVLTVVNIVISLVIRFL